MSRVSQTGDSRSDDESRHERIIRVIDDFLVRRAQNEGITPDDLIQEHRELMPELAEMLGRLARIDAAKTDAEDRAAADTVAFTDPGERPDGLHIRCPHCFHHVRLAPDEDVRRIVCTSCGNDFGLVDEEETEQHPERIANFEIVRRLGAGSFGTVWEARDLDLDRRVALKVPRKGKLEPREMEQFIREARVTAQLNHPGIVKVYEVGRDGDTVYIVSDLVEGVPLSELIDSTGMDPVEAANLIAQIADALDHAHSMGVVHRDLKPANVMMDKEMRPFITDFGLAKRHVADVTITADGHILGTPAYMSPEQANGQTEATDRRSDVYSVGVMFFELLTGERPFRGDISRLIKKVIYDEPPRPRDMRRTVPRDLETICLKCLEKDPHRRYQTAADLRDDLCRWLDDEPILARPIGRIEKAKRWCRKNPVIAAVVATAVMTLLLTSFAGLSVSAKRRVGLRLAKQELTNYVRRDPAELQQLRSIVREAAMLVKTMDFDPHRSEDLHRLVQTLYAKYDHSPFNVHPFATWFILDEDGTMLAIVPHQRDIEGHDFRFRDYYQGAMRAKEFEVFTSQPYRSENDNLVKFSLVTPVVVDGEKFIVGASVATEATRAIQREEELMRTIFRWTIIVLIPLLVLFLWLLVLIATRYGKHGRGTIKTISTLRQ